MLECAQLQILLRHAPEPPRTPRKFARPSDGARFMAEPAQEAAFDFLQGGERRILSEADRCLLPDSVAVGHVLERLVQQGLEAFVVDLTTDELRSTGLHAVRVVVPMLQPLTFNTSARFLDSRRLERAFTQRGKSIDSDVNRYPQPLG